MLNLLMEKALTIIHFMHIRQKPMQKELSMEHEYPLQQPSVVFLMTVEFITYQKA